MAIDVDLVSLDSSLIPSEYNLGVERSAQVNLKLTVTAPHITQSISGNVKKNGTTIAKFDRTISGILNENWFGGARQPIYLKNGDTLEVNVTSPISMNVTKNILRGGGDLVGDVVLPSAIEKCKVLLAGEENFTGNVVDEVIKRISVNHDVSLSNSFAANLGNIEKYLLSKTDLPPITINIFSDLDLLQSAIDELKPVTQREIFDTWPRFAHNTNGGGQLYWDNPANATGDAKAWQYNEANQRVTMPLNTATWNGFVSKKKYDNYVHEVTVGSTDGDDDWNGVVIGHVWQGGINKILGLTISTRNNASVFPGSTASTILVGAIDGAVFSGNGSYVPETSFMVANFNDPIVNAGWLGREKRIRIVRRGDLITIDISAWDSTSYDPVRRMVLDLNSDPKLAIFKGPQSYGYWNFSQAATYYKDIFFDDGERADTITYAPTGEVYTYDPLEGWVVEQGLSLVDIYSAPRMLIAATTSWKYTLNEDGSIVEIPPDGIVIKDRFGTTHIVKGPGKIAGTNIEVQEYLSLVITALTFSGSDLVEVVNWNWRYLGSVRGYRFNSCNGLIKVPTTLPIWVTETRGMFFSCAIFNSDISTWDVSRITDMQQMFAWSPKFNQDLSNWEVGEVLNMLQMFMNATDFNQDLSSWCVSKIPTKPSNFNSYGKWILPTPVWGTCPVRP